MSTRTTVCLVEVLGDFESKLKKKFVSTQLEEGAQCCSTQLEEGAQCCSTQLEGGAQRGFNHAAHKKNVYNCAGLIT